VKKAALLGHELREIWQDPLFEDKIREAFCDLHAHEIASSLDGLEAHEIARILLIIGLPFNVHVFEEFEDEDRRDILLLLSRQDRAKFIEEMAPDERVDLLKILPTDIQDDIYRLIAQAERNDIKRLIKYEEGSVGSVMTTEYAALPKHITIKEALERLRMIGPERETIYYVYVVDSSHHLIGIASLRNIILAAPHLLLENIMNQDVLYANAFSDQAEASKLISDYDLLALPVVDNDGKLMGIVTVDDIVDMVIEEDTEDILKYGAVEKHINYMRSNPFRVARQRVVWLLVLVFMGFISAYVLQRYHNILEAVAPLVFFIPLLCASGGNAGTQASTVVIRGLATDEISMNDLRSVFFKEIMTGVLMGCILAVVAAIRAFLVPGADIRLGIVVGVSMVLVVILANSLGALLPIVLKKMKCDPALVSGPFITSMVDIACLLFYLEIARMIYMI